MSSWYCCWWCRHSAAVMLPAVGFLVVGVLSYCCFCKSTTPSNSPLSILVVCKPSERGVVGRVHCQCRASSLKPHWGGPSECDACAGVLRVCRVLGQCLLCHSFTCGACCPLQRLCVWGYASTCVHLLLLWFWVLPAVMLKAAPSCTSLH